MRARVSLLFSMILMLTACIPAGPGTDTTATSAIPSATAFIPASATPTTGATPIPQASPTPTALSQTDLQFIAYIRDGQLLVTDVTGGRQGGTTQYTVTGESDQVTDLVWSPSGEFVAFVSTARGEPHVFYIYALGQSSPTDLGPGSAPAWSPDSQSVVYVGGAYPDNNLWITPIDNPAPRQLTFETNHAWGRPAFKPDGSALIVTTADRNNMGAQGNTSFNLEQLALDGSGTRTPLPGSTPLDGSRLPFDLRFSPDGTRLAFSTSYHWSACASPGAYYVSDADGSNRQEIISPSLKQVIDPGSEHFHVGLSYAWNATSNALIGLGNVVDCALGSPTSGQVLAGPQMSSLGLDGSESLVIPGYFYGISMDRTGTVIAAAHYQSFQDLNPILEMYSAHNGQLVLTLGPGNTPQFQP